MKLLLIAFAIGISGCAAEKQGDGASANSFGENTSTQDIGADPRKYTKDALIYNGDGAAAADWQVLVQLVKDHGLTYETASSSELNQMSVDEIANFAMIIWPGGYAGVASKSLSGQTRINVQKAIRERGVSFIGFCAGAFIAMNSPSASPTEAPSYGFSILPNNGILPEFEPHAHAPSAHDHDNESPIPEAITLQDGRTLDLVFYGGPYFPAAAEVLAKYKDGTPAIIQAKAGNAFVILSGPHPEAPASWVKSSDRDGLDQDRAYAWQLIEAAYKRQALPTF